MGIGGLKELARDPDQYRVGPREGVILRQGLHVWTPVFLILGLLKLGAIQEYGSEYFPLQTHAGYSYDGQVERPW